MSQWISAKDRFPNNKGEYLCFMNTNIISVGRFDPDFDCKEFILQTEKDGIVTHWMPLPEPPKAE